MCYLVAKDVNKHGCIVMKTRHGKHLADLSDDLDRVVAGKGIQIVTISSPAAYGEYAPYTLVNSEADFIDKVHAMVV